MLKTSPAQDAPDLLAVLIEACQKAGVQNAGAQNAGAVKTTARGFGSLDALRSLEHGVSASAASADHALAEDLSKLVTEDERFPGASVKMMRNEGRGAKFYPDFAGDLLIQRTLETGSPEAAIEWLQKVLATSAATGKTIHLLLGAPVDREIQLTKDIKIIPFAEIPDSVEKRCITDIHNSTIMNPLNFKPPESALIESNRIEPFTHDPDKRLDLSHEAYRQSHELLHEVALALTLVGPRAAVSASGWFSFDDPDLNDARAAASDQSGHVLGNLPAPNADCPVLDPVEAQSVVQGYLAVKGKTRVKARMALRRLNRALHRCGAGARAAELSPIFETLLGDHAEMQGDDGITASSFGLIGGADSDGKRNFDIVRQAYQIRRTFACSERVDETELRSVGGEKMTVRQIADHAIIIGADAIKTIIQCRAVPD